MDNTIPVNSVYIHIPFCLHKCPYCDFVSLPLSQHQSCREAYAGLLRSELDLWRGSFSDTPLDFSRLRTIYFGGGTPSLMEPDEIGSILGLLPAAEEITLEANPETLDRGKLAAFRLAGVNRLSLGAQSFEPRLLAAMGRGHSPADTRRVVNEARQEGFANISIDLIYGLPDQNLAGWQADLQQALALDTQHISLYGLALEPHTPWGEQAATGRLQLPDEDSQADMLELACDVLEQAGFIHYEIANFARPGWESLHNHAYWQRDNYLGLGVAAASCLFERRFYNQKNLTAYRRLIEVGRPPLLDEEWLNIDQVISEALFLGLRLLAGIDFTAFYGRYGVDPRRRYRREIERLWEKGLIELDKQGMRLTRRGLLLGNEVFRAFV
ncbi:MAG: radical SAM family heme chaperone HemW [Clostridia bacterium]|nr:radical SAM family heme chaperone HemW [Clostridia bacterium]